MPAVWFLSPHHFHHCYLAKFGPLLIIDGVRLSGLKEAILRWLFAFLTDPTLKIINHSFCHRCQNQYHDNLTWGYLQVSLLDSYAILSSIILVRFLRGIIFSYLCKILTWCYLQDTGYSCNIRLSLPCFQTASSGLWN